MTSFHIVGNPKLIRKTQTQLLRKSPLQNVAFSDCVWTFWNGAYHSLCPQLEPPAPRKMPFLTPLLFLKKFQELEGVLGISICGYPAMISRGSSTRSPQGSGQWDVWITPTSILQVFFTHQGIVLCWGKVPWDIPSILDGEGLDLAQGQSPWQILWKLLEPPNAMDNCGFMRLSNLNYLIPAARNTRRLNRFEHLALPGQSGLSSASEPFGGLPKG